MHTPTPWAYEPTSGAIYYADNDVEPVIAGINQDNTSAAQADADGAFIVHAVNHHDALVAWVERYLSSEPGPQYVRYIDPGGSPRPTRQGEGTTARFEYQLKRGVNSTPR